MKINRNFYLLLLVGEYVKYSTSLFSTWLTSFYSFRWRCHLWLRGNTKALLINLLKQLAIIYIPFRKLEGKEERVPKDIMQIPPKRLTRAQDCPRLPLPHEAAVSEPGTQDSCPPPPPAFQKSHPEDIKEKLLSIQRIFHLGKDIWQNITYIYIYIYIAAYICVHTYTM